MSTLGKHLHAAFHEPGTRIYAYVQGGVWGLILLSIALLVVEVLLPEGSPGQALVRRADSVLLTVFAVEIVLRVLSFQPPSLQVFRQQPVTRLRTHVLARLRYLVWPIMLVDILAVLALFPGLRGLRALNMDMNQPWLLKARDWLESVQHPDGGWGERANTYDDPVYKGQGPSTASQTAWALMGLCAFDDPNRPSIQRGIQYLIHTQNTDGSWSEDEITGTGFPKVYYLKYDMYRNAWPLLALATYKKLKLNQRPGQPVQKINGASYRLREEPVLAPKKS